MIRLLVMASLAAALSLPVRADYDAAGEAREAAARKAAQQEQAKRQAEGNRARNEANVKMMRGFVGKEAEGKSDAEVKRLYDERLAGYAQQAREMEKQYGKAK